MSEKQPEEIRQKRGPLVTALTLIILGLGFLALRLFNIPGWVVLVAIGLLFIFSALLTESPGFHIPGFILLGLGVGIGATVLVPTEDAFYLILLGLGLGFLALIPVYTMSRREHPWPIYPGGVLVFLGLAFLAAAQGLFGLTIETVGEILSWWPLVLVGIGVWLLYRWYTQRA